MNPIRIGFGLAALIAGPSLYALVQSGQMSGLEAFARGAIVAAVLVAGAGWILRLIDRYGEDVAADEQFVVAKQQIEAAERRARAQRDSQLS